MDSTQFTTDEVDLEAYRARLRKMTDEELIREGKTGRYLCSPTANFGKPPRKVFVVQLDEVKRDNKGELALSTIDREITDLRAILQKAVKWGFLAKNPAAQVEDYNEHNKRERFLTNEEIRKLLAATKQSESRILRPAVYLALETGMRKGELLSLRWTDVNFEAGQILIRETKNGEPRRVPMSRRARWLLRKMWAQCDPLTAEWVFQSRNRNGQAAPTGDIKTPWMRVLRKTGFEDALSRPAAHLRVSLRDEGWQPLRAGEDPGSRQPEDDTRPLFPPVARIHRRAAPDHGLAGLLIHRQWTRIGP